MNPVAIRESNPLTQPSEIKMKRISLLLVPLCVTALFAGCASGGYHYSQLVGARYNKAPIDTYPVSIVRVDGTYPVIKPIEVEPGTRQVTVQGPTTPSDRFGAERTIALEVEPCLRYYLVAVKENRLSNDFDVKVDYKEPIGGCTPPVVAAK
jgi:hypothetical protein